MTAGQGWSTPSPIGPWSDAGNQWSSHRQPDWLPPRPLRPRRRPGWGKALAAIYVMAQGVRLGVSSARRPVAVTLAWDAGAIGLVVAVVAFGAWRAGRRSGAAAPMATHGVRIFGWISALVALTVTSSLIGRNLDFTHLRGRTIAGAPGYSTYGGPHGYPLAEGAPWGSRCQPIRFSASAELSETDYDQIAAVVRSARVDGVDVTIENRDFTWYPDQVYPPGLTDSTVQRIGIFSDAGAPPRLADGRVERIGFGWDAAMSPDGRHEHLTDLQATLYLSQLEGHPDRLRIAIRQLIAFSQGVGASSAHGSGISRGTTVDSFSRSDLRAMEIMSGCDYPRE